MAGKETTPWHQNFPAPDFISIEMIMEQDYKKPGVVRGFA